MGNNSAFTEFETIVLAVYNKSITLPKPFLDAALLSEIGRAYEDSDIDMGGKTGERSADGLAIEEIVLKVMGVKAPVYPGASSDFEERREAYWEELHKKFFKITGKWGW